MAHDTPGDDVHTQTTGLQQRFRDMRRDIETAHVRRELTTLYTRARYLLTLTRTRSWEARFGHGVVAIRRVAHEECATTAQQINRRAAQMGTPADYAERGL